MENFRYLYVMKSKPVNKPSFDTIFSNAIASVKIEGIRFDKKAEAYIKEEALKKVETNFINSGQVNFLICFYSDIHSSSVFLVPQS